MAIYLKQLAALLRHYIDELPTIDKQKVRSIRKAIAKGTFSTNSHQTAEHLITFEHQLQRGKKTEKHDN